MKRREFSLKSSIGISYYDNASDDKSLFKFPLRISCCIKNFEFGIGTLSIAYNFLPNIFKPKIIYYLNQPFIGYRYKSKTNFLFRATFAPHLYNKVDEETYYRFGFFPWAGISFGYCF